MEGAGERCCVPRADLSCVCAVQESKLTESAKEVLSRQQDVQRELMGIAPTQAVWVGHLQRVATAVTDNLSQQLKRSVKLSGDINNWLS